MNSICKKLIAAIKEEYSASVKRIEEEACDSDYILLKSTHTTVNEGAYKKFINEFLNNQYTGQFMVSIYQEEQINEVMCKAAIYFPPVSNDIVATPTINDIIEQNNADQKMIRQGHNAPSWKMHILFGTITLLIAVIFIGSHDYALQDKSQWSRSILQRFGFNTSLVTPNAPAAVPPKHDIQSPVRDPNSVKINEWGPKESTATTTGTDKVTKNK